MSKAPRTEAAFELALELPLPKALAGMATFADKLECELHAANERADKEERRRLGAEACLKSWKEDEGADAARLEWLMNHAGGVVINLDDNFLTREEIDERMEADSE
jgi:hypothetical protein|tara:strand:- start:2858 stop:3175 length:318 start_codon:yes stop_codon:yes gene_type:complete